MGWLFGKKKNVVPQVPLPQGRPFDERSLQFPQRVMGDRVIEPEHLKAAVGINKPEPVEEQPKEMPMARSGPPPMRPEGLQTEPDYPGRIQKNTTPLYIKVNVYQQILGELDSLKKEMATLSETSKELDDSEYNEENNIASLKRSLKTLHDNILQADRTLFKS